jgi:hypothetical protein
MSRFDPGPCPICGAAHTACQADSGPITITQLPARDALQTVGEIQSTEPPAELVPPLGTVAEPAPFTTAEYTRKTHGLKRPSR